MDKKILMIDDDKDLCTIIKRYMQNQGFTIEFSHSGASGIEKAGQNNYLAIILDVMLPEIDGFSVLREIRKFSIIPILMLTAKDLEKDKIKGLEMGADDYMTKPFSLDEFSARIHSLIRRYTTFETLYPEKKTIVLRDLTIDLSTREVFIDKKEILLTGKEFDLLYFLVSNKGIVFTKKQIYNNVWKDEYAFDDGNIMAFISKLRKKIEKNAESPQYIQTIRGVGYRFNKEI